MLKTFQIVEHEDPAKRRISFSLKELLLRKSLPSQKHIMNTKVIKQKTSNQKTPQAYKNRKSSQSQSCKRQTLKLNYQILRTKSHNKLKTNSQVQQSKNNKKEAKNKYKSSLHLIFEDTLLLSKINVSKRTINKKNFNPRSLRKESQPLKEHVSTDLFEQRSIFNNSQNTINRKSLELKQRKQFLKKGSSLEKHVLNNLAKNKIIRARFPDQKHQLIKNQLSNLETFYKDFHSSLYSVQLFGIASKNIQSENNEKRKLILGKKSQQRCSTSDGFQNKIPQKVKQIVGWQVSEEFQFEIIKNNLKSETVTDSSWSQIHQFNPSSQVKIKEKNFNSKKILNLNL